MDQKTDERYLSEVVKHLETIARSLQELVRLKRVELQHAGVKESAVQGPRGQTK
jgi:hypothetical protein